MMCFETKHRGAFLTLYEIHSELGSGAFGRAVRVRRRRVRVSAF